MTSKRWAPGTRLTVDFLEPIAAGLANRIIAGMNLWHDHGASVEFVRSAVDPVIRITREDEGYWSNVGTDALMVPRDQPTMCFESWTENVRDSEWARVIPHEANHALGGIHEQLRAAVVGRIDPAKAVAYFARTQGWTADVTRANVLTPVDESLLIGTPADVRSLMEYDIPGECTYDGQPIVGGTVADEADFAFLRSAYPPVAALASVPVPVPSYAIT